jgi:hypothetical protein
MEMSSAVDCKKVDPTGMESRPFYREREGMGSQGGGSGFDGDWALKYVEEIAFPRRAGTQGEQKAAQTIVRILKGLGYETSEKDFYVLLTPWIWMKGILLISLLFLFVTWFTFGKIPYVAVFIASLFLLGIVVWERLWLYLGRWVVSGSLKRGMQSKNILAHLPGKEGGQPLYLVAHYDSKSQFLNLYLRTGFFLSGSASGCIFTIWVWIHGLRSWMGEEGFSIPLVIQGCFLLAVMMNLLLLFAKMGNDSEGAVDNASGVGVLLEVSRILIINKPSVINPIFLFTSAEEMGLLGSLMFRKRHGEEMVQKEGLLINIDSVGKEGKMRGCSSTTLGKRWLRQVLKVVQEKGIRLQTLPFHKGILMDHLPFCYLRIPSISLTSISREGWHLHTHRDRFCLIHKEGLVEMGRLVLGLIESLEIGRRKENGIKN